jgi:hypothetical protein
VAESPRVVGPLFDGGSEAGVVKTSGEVGGEPIARRILAVEAAREVGPPHVAGIVLSVDPPREIGLGTDRGLGLLVHHNHQLSSLPRKTLSYHSTKSHR